MRQFGQASQGGIVLTFFGAFWAAMSLAQNPSSLAYLLLGVTGLITLGLFARGVYVLKVTRRTPTPLVTQTLRQRRSVFIRFGWIVLLEVILIAVASSLLSATNRAEFIAPVVGVIVGLHFLPLASLFRERVYYLTGGLFILVSALAIVALLFGVTLGPLSTWSVIVGLSGACALYLTAAYLMFGFGLPRSTPIKPY